MILATIAISVWAVAFHRAASGAAQTHFGNRAVPLITSNRDALRICVDSKVAQVNNDQLRRSISNAVGAVRRHADFVRSGLGAVPVRIDVGCPGPARPMLPGYEHWRGTSPGVPLVVAEPSPYRVFVFVLPKEKLALPDGSFEWRGTQEMYCHEATCAEVTSALYLTPDDVSSAQRVAVTLVDSVGLKVPELHRDAPEPDAR
jgi:hypothetical protein